MALLFALATNCRTARSQDLDARVDAVIRNCRNVTKEFLQTPENADIVARLRQRAVGTMRDGRSILLLLRMDDPETVRFCVEKLAEDQELGGYFVTSENPRLILVLEPALFREESAKYQGEGRFRLWPYSVRAAWVVHDLITASAAFSPEVKEWNQTVQFGTTEGEAGRQQIRDWMRLNKAALEAGNFAAAKAPN